MTEYTTDFLIVGSGVAGSAIAQKILQNNLGSVLMIEAGSNIEMGNQRTWLDFLTRSQQDDWGNLKRYLSPFLPFHDKTSDYDSSGSEDENIIWSIRGGRMFGRGGSTLKWGGWCPRLKPEDFELKTNTGIGLDWPFSYSDLEAYYLKAEHFLGVAGDSKNQTPPRSNKFPFEAPPYTSSDGEVIEAMKSLGISYGHIPVARNAIPHNERPACQTIGTCKYCPIGARYTGNQTLDDLEKKFPNKFTLLLNTAASSIKMETRQHASELNYVNTNDRKTGTITAGKIILCAGAIETPKILQSSIHPSWWPTGIGNSSDNVGRYLTAHPFFEITLKSKTNPKKHKNELMFPTLGSRHYDTVEYQKRFEKMAIAAYYLKPNLNLGDFIYEGYDSNSIEQSVYGSHSYRLLGYLEGVGHRENKVEVAQGISQFGLPRTKIHAERPLYDVSKKDDFLNRVAAIGKEMKYETKPVMYPQRGDHASSTCRMSLSEQDGVVDQNLKVHGVDNIWVCSNAVFPSVGTANPTLTLVALALRLSEHLSAQAN